ncbi:hypothetical protein [Rhodococcus sp. BH5]|uniref:hypothetical protein n=1 Tax=Rhodococcus sp. BH5 TaxID=2871702 RepID=UPI0022CD8EE5|nr:hypothetical protein [Rhodococcus sp. BH5]MCZ9634746.1 hypothetical protein [Rhodococcus sp. BH5]
MPHIFVRGGSGFRQVEMTKNGDQQLAGGSAWDTVTSWTAGSGSTVVGNALVVSGSGAATIEVGSEWAVASDSKDWRVYRNGTLVWTKGSATGATIFTNTFPLTLADGDQLTVQGWTNAGIAARKVIKAGANTYLRVVPA